MTTTTSWSPNSWSARVFAWAVHLFTATGVVVAFLAILSVAAHQWQMAMFWLLIAQIIDGIDGTFARIAKVKTVLPNFDGKAMDYVIDFATYAIIPIYFMYEVQLMPTSVQFIGAAVALLASVLYYGMPNMVSDDLHFVGFPVMWNLVAYYLFYVVQFPDWVNFGIIIGLSIMHFVPLKYVYPSRTAHLFLLTLVVTITAFVVNSYILYKNGDVALPVKIISLLTLLYLVVIGVYHTFSPPTTR